MFVNKHFIHLGGVYFKKKKQCYNVKPSPNYFCVKTMIWLYLHICLNVPLNKEMLSIFPVLKGVYAFSERLQ